MGKIIDDLDAQFARLHQNSLELIGRISPQLLYRVSASNSCGELILRSAAAVEQTFGGLAANLWDDPFEWTLPEALATPEQISDYLMEVEVTRKRGFELFKGDDDLKKEIMAPSGVTQLLRLLLDTLTRAEHYLKRAKTTLESLQPIY